MTEYNEDKHFDDANDAEEEQRVHPALVIISIMCLIGIVICSYFINKNFEHSRMNKKTVTNETNTTVVVEEDDDFEFTEEAETNGKRHYIIEYEKGLNNITNKINYYEGTVEIKNVNKHTVTYFIEDNKDTIISIDSNEVAKHRTYNGTYIDKLYVYDNYIVLTESTALASRSNYIFNKEGKLALEFTGDYKYNDGFLVGNTYFETSDGAGYKEFKIDLAKLELTLEETKVEETKCSEVNTTVDKEKEDLTKEEIIAKLCNGWTN